MLRHLFINFLLCVVLQNIGFAQRLELGEKAPNISVTDIKGNKQNLKTIVKNKKVLAVFFRYAWCPICNMRTHELIENYSKLQEKGYEVLAFYQTEANKLLPYVEDHKIPFPVIADFEGKYYQLYKLEYNKDKFEKSFGDERTKKAIEKALTISDYESEKKKYEAKDGNEPAADLIPGDFIINRKGIIERAYYGAFFGDHLPLSEVVSE